MAEKKSVADVKKDSESDRPKDSSAGTNGDAPSESTCTVDQAKKLLERDAAERAEQCMGEIRKVLDSYSCQIQAYCEISSRGVKCDWGLIPIPKST